MINTRLKTADEQKKDFDCWRRGNLDGCLSELAGNFTCDIARNKQFETLYTLTLTLTLTHIFSSMTSSGASAPTLTVGRVSRSIAIIDIEFISGVLYCVSQRT